MGKKFDKWLRLILVIPDDIYTTNCPNCKNKDLNYQYVGDHESKIGYLDI